MLDDLCIHYEVFNGFFPLPDKTIIPKSVNDVKLIYSGKVLENSKTLAESRILFGDLPGGVITMHVVVQPPLARKKTGMSCFISSFWSALFETGRILVHKNQANPPI
uniref:UBL3-like ubiquitin domain-containing protein n=1 Tax=Nelumbo nucifera TaxID=4432 RepID=A0A822YGT7_NELNU|nr:TPA_asm: hypothetical protein HUJ06_012255 [Nelumbo nucifera]